MAFTRLFHRAFPSQRPGGVSRSSLSVSGHFFSWSLVDEHQVRGGVGRNRFIISSPLGRFAIWLNRLSFLWSNCAGIQGRRKRRRSSTVDTQSLCLMCWIRWMQSASIRSLITLARSAFSRLQSWLWSRREISLCTKSRVYQAVVQSILLYGCQTWPVRVADERMLDVFDNESIHRIQQVRRTG